MRRIAMLLACAAALAGCSSPDAGANAQFAADVNATDADIRNAVAADAEGRPPPYVAGPDDAAGENAMTTAIPDQHYYRDLPAARLFRGDWTVRKSAWFAVSGSDTPARSVARMRAFEGARVRIDRQRILIAPRNAGLLARVTLDCSGVGYLDKDRIAADERRMRDRTTREDAMIDYAIAVPEKEISRVFANSQTVAGEVVSLICPLSDTGDAEAGAYPLAYPTGAMLIDRNRMALIFSDGTTLYAERDPQ